MQRNTNVKEKGTHIGKLVKEVENAIKADKKSNSWRNYQDYINCIVIDGICASICTALNHLNEQIDPENIKNNNIQPMFDIKLELTPEGI